MSSSLRRLATQLPGFSRGFQSSALLGGGHGPPPAKGSHEFLVHGDGHHGLRPGYNYDYEHGPHYLQPRKVTNFMWKWNVGMKLLMFTSCSIPCFAIWWQLSKAAA